MIYKKIEILSDLIDKYGNSINPNLKSVKILQSEKDCFIMSQFNDDIEKLYLENLDIIADDNFIEVSDIINPSMFNPQNEITENVKIFLDELDKETIAMCFSEIIVEDVKSNT
ncbi:hypothetical protein M4I21_13555 [Cellulophaga sp. 20_2_10]|uniref:hypothetical protein n=1 Tax=Cellulophaga sp. 20_2_10 TaxID=2942476 RepID=UPI00201A49E2|nr:hypothetical protein [Cellulophaga sp. 20_2_10]MCL5246844.1 hypothetical protein [Cellulophaga sp. 20_2_10]